MQCEYGPVRQGIAIDLCALASARRGYRVGAYDIELAGLASLREATTATGGDVAIGQLDVTGEAAHPQDRGGGLEVVAGQLQQGLLAPSCSSPLMPIRYG